MGLEKERTKITLKDKKICETPEQLFKSEQFKNVLEAFNIELQKLSQPHAYDKDERLAPIAKKYNRWILASDVKNDYELAEALYAFFVRKFDVAVESDLASPINHPMAKVTGVIDLARSQVRMADPEAVVSRAETVTRLKRFFPEMPESGVEDNLNEREVVTLEKAFAALAKSRAQERK